MADALKVLGAAALTTDFADIYKPAAGASAMVSSFRLVNTSTSAATVVYGAVGASTYYIIPKALNLAACEAYVDSDAIALDSSQNMKFWATPATVHCTIFGVEHT
jgi:hypothetical protein